MEEDSCLECKREPGVYYKIIVENSSVGFFGFYVSQGKWESNKFNSIFHNIFLMSLDRLEVHADPAQAYPHLKNIFELGGFFEKFDSHCFVPNAAIFHGIQMKMPLP